MLLPADLELGAVYRLPSGRFALLMLETPVCCLFHTVDVHRIHTIVSQPITLSPAMANRCRLAWHAHQWADRAQARALLDLHRAADLAESARQHGRCKIKVRRT